MEAELKQTAGLPDWPGYVFTSDGEIIKLASLDIRGGKQKARRIKFFFNSAKRSNKTPLVFLSADGGYRSLCSVQLLIVRAFFPEYDAALHRIGYKDGDKSNVSLSNLYLYERKQPLW